MERYSYSYDAGLVPDPTGTLVYYADAQAQLEAVLEAMDCLLGELATLKALVGEKGGDGE